MKAIAVVMFLIAAVGAGAQEWYAAVNRDPITDEASTLLSAVSGGPHELAQLSLFDNNEVIVMFFEAEETDIHRLIVRIGNGEPFTVEVESMVFLPGYFWIHDVGPEIREMLKDADRVAIRTVPHEHTAVWSLEGFVSAYDIAAAALE